MGNVATRKVTLKVSSWLISEQPAWGIQRVSPNLKLSAKVSFLTMRKFDARAKYKGIVRAFPGKLPTWWTKLRKNMDNLKNNRRMRENEGYWM